MGSAWVMHRRRAADLGKLGLEPDAIHICSWGWPRFAEAWSWRRGLTKAVSDKFVNLCIPLQISFTNLYRLPSLHSLPLFHKCIAYASCCHVNVD